MSLLQAFEAIAKENSSDVEISQIPTLLLESFIPSYAIVSKLVLNSFSVDITNIVSLLFVAFVVYTAARYTLSHAFGFLHEYFTSSISVEDGLLLFDCLIEWLGEQESTASARNLMVGETNQSFLSEIDPETGNVQLINQEHGWINYRNRLTVAPTQYLPDRGMYWFFWSRRLFWMNRQRQTIGSSTWNGSMCFRNRECVRIRTIGKSTQPIKDLFKATKDAYRDRSKSTTRVYRPAAEDKGRREWKKVAKRASRPIDTVILDRKQKSEVLNDINEYLHPATGRWYANRGIPYRRGYLFYGPPGAGKSSFAWAIAGVFGVDIYCISLADPNMTEDSLAYLFSDLPKRCVVLLEDIDSAGLDKRETTDKTVFEKEKKSITLSGLLNVIDGVAAHEGHVLVMTTNFPGNLDAALIRPGRIDKMVAFTLATTEQIAELFIRMYSSDKDTAYKNAKATSSPLASTKKRHDRMGPQSTNSTDYRRAPSVTSRNNNLHYDEKSRVSETSLLDAEIVDNESQSSTSPSPPSPKLADPAQNPQDLKSIAQIFASKLPTLTFSPAEIQGFLLTRKTEPLKALAEVTVWKDEILVAKAKKEHAVQQAQTGCKRGSVSSEKTEVETDERIVGTEDEKELTVAV